MKPKLKECHGCGEDKVIWKNIDGKKYCRRCAFIKESDGEKKPQSRKRKVTGEWALFMKIYAERKGICEVTGAMVKLEPSSFAHILSKGAYPSLRLDPENIMLVDEDIHHLYDNSSRDKLLEKYPGAIVMFEKKEKLKSRYYNGKDQ